MFDLRYHIASLAAVFVALAVGIVIGVAIAGGGNLEETTQDLRQADFDALESRRAEAEARAVESERREAAAEGLLDDVYPALMAGRLEDTDAVLVFLGEVDGTVRRAVERTLFDAGAGSPVHVTAFRFPIDVDGINERLEVEPAFAGYVGDGRLGDLGLALGRELARGGTTPLLDLLAFDLVEERSGLLLEPAEAIVVARAWSPPPSDDPAEEGRRSQSEALITGIVQGLGESGVPTVGVETTGMDESTIDLFRRVGGVSSVDHVDTRAGRVALAVLLAGGQAGHYGTKRTADGAAPPIDPLVPAGLVG